MNLFIDIISREGNIIIFDDNRKIKDKIILNIK
jgi:predicted ribosome quality control (RQC) complex YloA/Tae2 family protein